MTESAITQSGRQIEALQIESELLYFRKNHGVAGVWMNVLLTTLGDAIIVLKRLLKQKSPLGLWCLRQTRCACVVPVQAPPLWYSPDALRW